MKVESLKLLLLGRKQGNAPQQRGEFNISRSESVNTFNPFCTILQKNKMTDMHTAALMADHFDKIQKLPNPIEGVPNFRCVPGYQVIKHVSFVTHHISCLVKIIAMHKIIISV